MPSDRPPLSYRDAGVDIDAGEALVERIKPHVRRTLRPEVLTDLGGFAGLCALPAGYRDPLLVACTDGVGTKLKLAFATGIHDTVGIDLVAMNVNDLCVSGAEPLFFLDYFAAGALDVAVAERVIAGIAEGCRQAGCALLGGETAELPGFYQAGEYDLAGFCVGVVERDRRVDGKTIAAGDTLLALASSGFHSNGYSLVRKVFLEQAGLALDAVAEGLDEPLGQALLRPTRIYVRALAQAARRRAAQGSGAHHRRRTGRKSRADAARRCAAETADRQPRLDLAPTVPCAGAPGANPDRGDAPDLQSGGRDGGLRGHRSRGGGRAASVRRRRDGLPDRPGGRQPAARGTGGVPGMNVGVLASGTGSNLQALLDAGSRGELGPARIAAVAVNVAGCGALERAERAGVPAFVIEHRTFSSRAEFDRALAERLQSNGVELVVLAGFMRLLGADFLRAFSQRIINVHPALLPAFPGLHPQRQALDHGVRFSGCTVHFVDEGTDSGPIIGQTVVPVLESDDEQRLARRILTEEHRLLPAVVRALAEGRVRLEGRRVRVSGSLAAGAPDSVSAVARLSSV